MPPELGRKQLTQEERRDAERIIQELFGIDTTDDPDPFIDLPMIATLAGVADGTPAQWQQRTRKGEMSVPFPEPDDTRYADKPQWCAISTIIEEFLLPTGRWPRGAVARPQSRGPRAGTDPVTFAQLRKKRPELAAEVERLQLNDRQRRTPLQWAYRVRKAKRAQEAQAQVA